MFLSGLSPPSHGRMPLTSLRELNNDPSRGITSRFRYAVNALIFHSYFPFVSVVVKLSAFHFSASKLSSCLTSGRIFLDKLSDQSMDWLIDWLSLLFCILFFRLFVCDNFFDFFAGTSASNHRVFLRKADGLARKRSRGDPETVSSESQKLQDNKETTETSSNWDSVAPTPPLGTKPESICSSSSSEPVAPASDPEAVLTSSSSSDQSNSSHYSARASESGLTDRTYSTGESIMAPVGLAVNAVPAGTEFTKTASSDGGASAFSATRSEEAPAAPGAAACPGPLDRPGNSGRAMRPNTDLFGWKVLIFYSKLCGAWFSPEAGSKTISEPNAVQRYLCSSYKFPSFSFLNREIILWIFHPFTEKEKLPIFLLFLKKYRRKFHCFGFFSVKKWFFYSNSV